MKLIGQSKQGVPSKARVTEFLYLARIVEIEDEVSLAVSFLKRQADGTYLWPDQEDISSVDKQDIVKMSRPNEETVSRARVRFIFAPNDINAARIALKVSANNVR